jgi:hypothetical protein
VQPEVSPYLGSTGRLGGRSCFFPTSPTEIFRRIKPFLLDSDSKTFYGCSDCRPPMRRIYAGVVLSSCKETRYDGNRSETFGQTHEQE